MIIMMALNVLREAKDTAGGQGTCSLCFSTTSGTAGRLYFLYLETICISCVENRYTVLQIAEADSHAYLEVVMSSIEKESEPMLAVGFIQDLTHKFLLGYFTRNQISPHMQFMLCLLSVGIAVLTFSHDFL